jgi:phosphoribosylglycinamide formyltransferase-1
MTASPQAPLSLVVLISGNGTNLQAIIDACASGKLNAQVSTVISNRPQAYGLERAKAAGIETHIINHAEHTDRRSFELQLEQVIDQHKPDLVILAGFMRILTADFVNHYLGKMLNIHPSLLPNLTGLNTHQRAIDTNIKEHGVSVHFVTPELDGGPVIHRATVSIENNDSAETLAAKVQQEEYRIYPEVIQWFAEGRLQLINNQAMLDNKPIKQLEKIVE